MASIFRKPRSPFWFAAYRDARGQRKQKSTKTKDRRVALDAAIQWEKLAEKGRNGTLTEAVARSVVSELVRQATGEPLHFASCRSWLEEWVSGKAGSTADGTLKKYRQVIDDFITSLAARADLPLAAISPKDIRTFRDSLATGGRAPTTVNQTIKKTLSVPFLAAQRLGYISVNPCAGVENLRDDGASSREVFSREQVGLILAAAEGDWKGAILAGYFTGLRLRDISELLWESIYLETGILRLKTRKTGAELVLPLHPELANWLRSQPRGIAKAPVFPKLIGKGTGGRNGLSGRFLAVMAKANITGRRIRERNGAGRATTSLSFHSLRHSFVSALANAGVATDLRQRLAGHADARSHARYTHHEIEGMRAAIEMLPGLEAAN